MSRVLSCLVALSMFPSVIAAQTTTQAFVAQGSGGVVGTSTIQGGGVVGGVPGQMPPRDAQPARTGTSRIRGRVMLADTGQPARRASVRVMGGGLREPVSTVTDADGRYEIRDLPAGRYTLTAGKNTYVTVNYGQTRPNEPGRPLDIADNQLVEKVDFSLPRGGVITGRVLDEYGEPVANAMVQPMQNRFMNGQQRPMTTGTPFTTSDTGEYRLWGLSPGQYFVSANSRGMNAFMMDNSDDRSGYAATFYPSTANVAEAQPITIAAGQTASGVDIMLVMTRTSRVSGTAVDARGEPVRMGMVMAMPRVTTGGFSPQGGQIRPDGTFTISGLTAGEYILRATIPQARAGGGQPEMLSALVTVAGADVTGLVLSPVQPAVVKGRVVFDPPTAALQASMIQLTVTPRNPEPMLMVGMTGPPRLNDDFTFEATASPGQMVIRAFVRAPSSSSGPWVVKSVRYDSSDITDRGIDLAGGRSVEGVEIVLTNRVQEVSGQVTDARLQVVTDATVMIFAQDKDHWDTASRYLAFVRPDQNGRYSVRTLPPGDYYAVALQQVDQTRRGDPAYYELLMPEATRFTLTEAETRALDLRLTVAR